MADEEEAPALTPENLAWLEAHGCRRPDDTDGAGGATPRLTGDPSVSGESSQAWPECYVCAVLKCLCVVPRTWSEAAAGHQGKQAVATSCPPVFAVGTGPRPACAPSGFDVDGFFPPGPGPGAGDESDSPAVGTLPSLPLFDPGTSAARGLDVLAAAADADVNRRKPTEASLSLLSQPGPFNPAASLSMKVVKKILDLEFVEMSEVMIDDMLPAVPGRPPPPARLPITDISQWVERFSLMAAVLCSKFPDKVAELFAYQASIVRAERNYEGKRWVAYDRRPWQSRS